MKRILYVLLTILASILVFSVILFLFSLNKSKGALQVTSSPNAKVYLNGKLIGNSPLCKCNLKDMITEGEYTIKLIPVSGGFDSFEQKITISGKVLTVVDKNFEDKGLGSASIISLSAINDKKEAQISVVTFPSRAKVFLDNNLKGESPILLKNVKEADHEIKITKNNYKDKIVRIRAILGFRLDNLIYLGLNKDLIPTSSGLLIPLISSSSSGKNLSTVTILDTPTGFLRVRQEPNISSSEIVQVKPGQKFTLLGEQVGWFKIDLSNGKTGWISSQYAQKN